MSREPFRPVQAALGLLALVLVMLGWHAAARAAELTARGLVLTAAECRNFAEVIEQAADARDTGIPHKLYAAYIERRFMRGGSNLQLRGIVHREIRGVYTAALMTAELLRDDGYTRCMTGPIGAPES